MAKQKVSMRLTEETLNQLDKLAKYLSESLGVKVTRTGAMEYLVKQLIKEGSSKK